MKGVPSVPENLHKRCDALRNNQDTEHNGRLRRPIHYDTLAKCPISERRQHNFNRLGSNRVQVAEQYFEKSETWNIEPHDESRRAHSRKRTAGGRKKEKTSAETKGTNEERRPTNPLAAPEGGPSDRWTTRHKADVRETRDSRTKCSSVCGGKEPSRTTPKGIPRHENVGQRGRKFTPLNSSRESILQECLDKEFKEAGITPSKPLRETGKTDRTRYCQYYQSCSHNIYDCYQLCDTIEEIIVNGKMVRFAKDIQEERGWHVWAIKREAADPKVAGDVAPKTKKGKDQASPGVHRWQTLLISPRVFPSLRAKNFWFIQPLDQSAWTHQQLSDMTMINWVERLNFK